MRVEEKIGPNLGFDQYHGYWMDSIKSALHTSALINGIINLRDMAGEFPPQFTHAGRGSGGHDNLEIRGAGFQGADKLGAEIHFAYAYCVQPQDLAIGDCLLYLRAVMTKSLGKSMTPVAPPQHPQKVVGR
jgi:hypothetical protein